MARQIKRLMDDIVAEHESKRKSEFDTLQSQINPHFLYNTLDIIVWMIENEKQSEAVKAVTALARFLREKVLSRCGTNWSMCETT